MSFSSQDIAMYFFAAALIILLAAVFLLEKKISRLLRGRKAVDLEEIISSLSRDIEGVEEINDLIKKHLQNMEERVKKSIQHVKTIRFNPFREQGGNQSFATAFLDEEGNGVVVSSLYSRDRVSVYAKPITRYTSAHELSAEEKAAIGK